MDKYLPPVDETDRKDRMHVWLNLGEDLICIGIGNSYRIYFDHNMKSWALNPKWNWMIINGL